MCETGNRRVTRLEHDGSLAVLADEYGGRRLNRPNDVVLRSDGTVYFTDPAHHLPTATEDLEQDVQGVYRVTPDRVVERVIDDFDETCFPNGLAFSLDERTLYVAESRHHVVRAYDVTATGEVVGGGRVFADMRAPEAGVPDGIRLDVEGNLYVGGSGGVWVIAPDGAVLGRAVIPVWAHNLAFGDEDMRTIYITAGTYVYRMRVNVPGRGLVG
jgi:gluconolactonase